MLGAQRTYRTERKSSASELKTTAVNAHEPASGPFVLMNVCVTTMTPMRTVPATMSMQEDWSVRHCKYIQLVVRWGSMVE